MKRTFLTDQDVAGIKYDPIKFTTGAISLALTLDGIGKVKINFGDGTATEKLLNGEASFKHRYAGKVAAHLVTIEGASNIKVLSAPKCAIENIEFTANSSIEKLVLYGNNIDALDVSMLKALQYLHIFNNPVCANEAEIRKTFKGLPDRNGKAFGSIVMYPFYPLGVLVYKNGSTLTKYPNRAAVAPVEGQLYRDMNAADVKWYKYENSAFVEQTEQNHLINLRIAMEAIALPLGWLFGSAIQYDEAEYAKCDFYFNQNHVQDYWETAERGLGIRVGVLDHIAGQLDGFENMNVLGYVNMKGENTVPREAISTAAQYTHGDGVLSTVAFRGGKLYGIAPDCQLYLVDYYYTEQIPEADYSGSIERLTANSDIISNSAYPSDSALGTDYLRILGDTRPTWEGFAERGLIFASSGNDGDGVPWVDEGEHNDWGVRFGDSAYIVSGLQRNDTFYLAARKFDCGSYTDVFAQYANCVMAFDSYSKSVVGNSGTSVAAPICTGIVLLMMNVYRKIYGAEASCGKHSGFTQFVTIHTDPLYDQMNRAVGNGKPDLMYYNKLIAESSSVPVTAIEIADVNAIHGEGVDVAPVVTPENADNIAVTYDYDLSRLAIQDNRVYPLIEQESTIEVTAYSNMNEEITATFNVNIPAAVSNASVITETKLPTTLADGKVSVLGNNRAKNYTIQMLIKFADVDTNTTNTVFDFYTDDGKHNPYMRLMHKTSVNSQTLGMGIKRLYADGTWKNVSVDFGARGVLFESLEGKNYVLTFTVKDGKYEVLLSGNTVGGGNLIVPIPLYDWRINADVLVNGSADDVLVYDRALTYEEIIQNTIAMLNKA